jgi:hypothetical protein
MCIYMYIWYQAALDSERVAWARELSDIEAREEKRSREHSMMLLTVGEEREKERERESLEKARAMRMLEEEQLKREGDVKGWKKALAMVEVCMHVYIQTHELTHTKHKHTHTKKNTM